MANSALSNLDTGDPFSAGDLIYVVQDGNSRKRALVSLGARLLNDTGTTGALTSIGIPALGRSLLDDTGQTTMQTTLGLGTAARENIGTAGANVPLMSTANTWSGDQRISSALPRWSFVETDGTTTHNRTDLAQQADIFRIESRDNSGSFVSNDYLLDKGASGATRHRWLVAGSTKLTLNSSGLTIADGIADTGVHLAAYFAGGVNADTGTFFRGDGTWAAPVGGNAWTYATPQATTSGTAFDFTGIPTGVSEIEISLEGVSLSGTDNLLIQIGDAGGIETTGYVSGSTRVAEFAGSTAGFILYVNNASLTTGGIVSLHRYDSTGVDWSSIHGVSTGASGTSGGGNKTLSAELTQVRLTRTGTNTFDAGQVSLRYR